MIIAHQLVETPFIFDQAFDDYDDDDDDDRDWFQLVWLEKAGMVCNDDNAYFAALNLLDQQNR